MPYRQPPTRAGVRRDDPPRVVEAFGWRERFGSLDATELWRAPSWEPFASCEIDHQVVSADGTRILVAQAQSLWLIDTSEMSVLAIVDLPSGVSGCGLSADGAVAAILCGHRLFRWCPDAGERTLDLIWELGLGDDEPFIQLSADGLVCVVARRDPNATVRVFDVAGGRLLRNFVTDTDGGLVLHPSGRHVIAFGHDERARIYGRHGLESELSRTTGGAVSPDGRVFVCNDLDDPRRIRIHRIGSSSARLRLAKEQEARVDAPVCSSNPHLRLSPSGRKLLAEGSDGRLLCVSLPSGRTQRLRLAMSRTAGFTGDEGGLILPKVDGRAFGISTRACGVGSLVSGRIRGLLSVATRERVQLVGVSPSGVWGSVETHARPMGEEAALPYERPGSLSPWLAGGELDLPPGEGLYLQELRGRQGFWARVSSMLAVELPLRQLVDLNRGLLELSEELLFRAAASSRERTSSLGKARLSFDALEGAATQLRDMTPATRERTFWQMIERLRGGGRDGNSDAQLD